MWLVMGLLWGCVEDDASLAVDAAPPPISLVADPLVSGSPFTLQVDGAVPGDTVVFVYGSGAGRTCLPTLAPECLGVANPSMLGTAVADAFGHAERTWTLPPTVAAGTIVPFQAAITGATPMVSNVEVRTVQAPTPSFRVTLVSAVIQADPPGSETVWDSYAFIAPFTHPDPFVDISVSGVVVGRTAEIQDSLRPMWNATATVTVLPGDTLALAIYDADIAPLPNDLIRTFTLSRAQLDGLRGRGNQVVSGGPVTRFTIRVE